MGMLDNFILPEGAAEDIQRRGYKETTIDEGVTKFMSGHDKGVPFKFRTETIYNKTKSKLAGYEVFDEIEVIQWLVDRRHKPVEQVRFLPEDLLSFDKEGNCIGGRFMEAYIAWKNGKQVPGMPLSKWGVLSEGEVATLHALGVFTVEQLAAQPKGRFNAQFPQSFKDAFERAQQYVASSSSRDAVKEQAERIADQAAMIEKLSSRLAELEAKKETKASSKKKVEEDAFIVEEE